MLDIQKTCKRRESLELIEDKHLQLEKNKINRADLESAVQQKRTKQRRASPKAAKQEQASNLAKTPNQNPSLVLVGV